MKIRDLWAVVITLVVVAIILSGCLGLNCTYKDPQVALPGWVGNQVEFGESYEIMGLRDEFGTWTYFLYTSPGWYGTQDGSNIENVMMCQ